jgi:phage/plasmid-like protein (TIGR03299 family)
MSANLCVNDGRVEFACNVNNGRAWHKQGVEVKGNMTVEQALIAANLDWKVEKIPALSSFDLRPIPGAHVVIRKDNNNPLGVVGDRYNAINNTEAFSFFNKVMGDTSSVIDAAGALGQGEKVFMIAKLPESFEVRGNDKVEQYLLVSNSHNGTSTLQVTFTAIRVVCQNTLTAALRGNKGFVNIRHSKGAEAKFQAAIKTLQAQSEYWKSLKQYCTAFAEKDVTSVEVGSFLESMFPTKKVTIDENGTETVEDKKRINTKNRDKVLALFEGEQKGADMAGKTAWGLVNAYTEWLDWHRTSRVESNWEYSAFGKGQDDRQKAFDYIAGMVGV